MALEGSGEKTVVDVLQAIHERRSIRSYTDEPVSRKDILTLLRAAMVGPTAHNGQEWRFVVVDDKDLLHEIPTINPYARMSRRAQLGILVCADLHAEKTPGFWIQDCCAAIENILLAAAGIGLGAVWTGISDSYPEMIKKYQALFHLPEHILPAGFIVIGHGKKEARAADRYDSKKVHYNSWGTPWEEISRDEKG